jgi:hypothetical protein
MKESELQYAIYFSVGLTLLIALIRLFTERGVKVQYLFNLHVFLYLLILLVGNIATTLLAVKLTQDFFSHLSGPNWFWISFLGVFGFEAIIKNINITIFKTGVLTINDWIERALDTAVNSVRQSEKIQDDDAELVIAKPGSDFRFKILSMEIVIDIEKPEFTKIKETQKLRCCVDRLNEIATQVNSDGIVQKFEDTSGNVRVVQKGKFRTVFPPKKKGDVFERKLTYELTNSFMNEEEESWSIEFETPTRNYMLTVILPDNKILRGYKFHRILHLTHEIDHKGNVAEGDENGRAKLNISMDNLLYKETFILSWRWQNVAQASIKQ